MADKTPREIIAEGWFADNCGGISDPIITDMIVGLAISNAAKAIAALEAAGYRIIAEPTAAMVEAAAREHYIGGFVDRGREEREWDNEMPSREKTPYIDYARGILRAALAAAPTWGKP